MIDEQLIHAPEAAATEPKAKSIFDAIPPKAAFFTGMIAGVMAFCTIGFIIILASGADWSKLGFAKGDGSWGKVGLVPNSNGNSNGNSNSNTNAPAANDKLANLPPITAADHVRGDLSKAKVVMIEYSDYECPFCKTFHPTLQDIVKTYGTDVAWIYRYFPLSFHQNAEKEAEAAECVASLGGNTAFWNFSDKIYSRTTSNGTGFALTALGPLAKEVGVDQAKFQTCLDSGKFAKVVADDEAGGSASGVDGTPATIILSKTGGSQVVTGAQSEATVKAAIDGMLK